MTTNTHDHPHDHEHEHEDGHQAEVVPLRAEDAQTEVRLDEQHTSPPSYVDLSDGREQRHPVIPEHWRTREAIRRHLGLSAERMGHKAAYHGVRAPWYLLTSTGWAVVGVFRIAGRLLAWWHVPSIRQLEVQAAADGLVHDHLRLHRAGKETRRTRGVILAIGAACAFAVLVAMVRFAPWWAWAALVAVAFPSLARAGRPASKPIVGQATLPAQVQPPSPEVITRALGALGIAEINKVLREGREITFPAPVREDGPGWRAELDLPFGVTATQVIERREQLASGLRRPLGAVWPEPVSDEHTGRLELWVGRTDVSKAKPPPWPLLRSGQADVFQPMPFGTDVRGRTVKAPLIYHNWLIGAIPRQGKTAAVRVLAGGAALDPLCELWLHELKGSGDLDPLEQVCHRFISGIHDEAMAYTAESLRLLRAEIERRTERLKKLPRDLCPDKRVTRQIAAKRGLRLWPVGCQIDEAQNLFLSKWGKQAADDAEFIIKIGPAFGVFLMLATQRPDRDSLPKGISANASIRFCLKVMGQVENDMILGTSAYKNGIRATTFRPEIDAGIGYLVGASAAPQVVRTYYLDMPATERIAARARALREHAGTLSGVALGDDHGATPRDVLADVLTALGGDNGLHWQPLAERLAERFPDRWADATGDAVREECAARGVPSVDVRYPPGRNGVKLKGCRRDLAEKAMRQ